MWFKIVILQQLWWKSHTIFQPYLWNVIRIMERFMWPYVKVGIVQQVLVKVYRIKYQQYCEIIYGIHGSVHLCPYIKQSLLWINMAESSSFSTVFSGSCPYQVWRTRAHWLGSILGTWIVFALCKECLKSMLMRSSCHVPMFPHSFEPVNLFSLTWCRHMLIRGHPKCKLPDFVINDENIADWWEWLAPPNIKSQGNRQ